MQLYWRLIDEKVDFIDPFKRQRDKIFIYRRSSNKLAQIWAVDSLKLIN